MATHGDTGTGPEPTDLPDSQDLDVDKNVRTGMSRWTVRDLTPGENQRRGDNRTIAAFLAKDKDAVTLPELVAVRQAEMRQERGYEA